MKTQVKIYRESENVELLTDEKKLKEYQKLVAELGMKEVKEEKTPNVYTPINPSMSRCLTELCPSKVNYKDYTKSTIPVEVLQTISFIVKNEMFDEIEIWCDDKNPDPLVIGKKYRSDSDRENGYSWNMFETLIARWGDCACEITELLQMGRERIKKRMTNEAIDKMSKAEMFLKNPDVYVDKYVDSAYNQF